jgi:hypothetical protein
LLSLSLSLSKPIFHIFNSLLAIEILNNRALAMGHGKKDLQVLKSHESG